MSFGQILTTQGGYSLTQQHLNEYYKFVSFILGQKPDPADEQKIKQDLINSFNNDPVQTLQSLQALPQQMQAIYQMNNPIQYALARSMFLAQLYMAYAQQLQTTGQAPLMMQLIDKYTPIIVIDAQNGLAFTEKDLQGIVKLAKVNAQMQGQNFSVSQKDIEQMRKTLEEQFMNLDLETKQAFCVMGVYGDYMEQAYAQLTPQQKQQLKQQYVSVPQQETQQNYTSNNTNNNTNWPQGKEIFELSAEEFNKYLETLPKEKQKKMLLAYIQYRMNASKMLYNTMSNIMQIDHATNMNIIENIGDTGYEWRVDYDYDYDY